MKINIIVYPVLVCAWLAVGSDSVSDEEFIDLDYVGISRSRHEAAVPVQEQSVEETVAFRQAKPEVNHEPQLEGNEADPAPILGLDPVNITSSNEAAKDPDSQSGNKVKKHLYEPIRPTIVTFNQQPDAPPSSNPRYNPQPAPQVYTQTPPPARHQLDFVFLWNSYPAPAPTHAPVIYGPPRYVPPPPPPAASVYPASVPPPQTYPAPPPQTYPAPPPQTYPAPLPPPQPSYNTGPTGALLPGGRPGVTYGDDGIPRYNGQTPRYTINQPTGRVIGYPSTIGSARPPYRATSLRSSGGPRITCENDEEAPCLSGEKCVPLTQVCDGERDCVDGSDEMACGPRGGCEGDDFRCANGALCLPSILRCDGTPDCHDGSDEYQCDKIQKDAVTIARRRVNLNEQGSNDQKNNTAPVLDQDSAQNPVRNQTLSCSAPDVWCDDKTACIKISSVCDKKQDCVDNSDENGCPEE